MDHRQRHPDRGSGHLSQQHGQLLDSRSTGQLSVYARLCVATSPRSKSVVSAMQVKSKLLERKSIGERIKEQILDLVATFEIGLGLGLMLGKKLAHDSKAAVLQQNSEKAVKKFAEI